MNISINNINNTNNNDINVTSIANWIMRICFRPNKLYCILIMSSTFFYDGQMTRTSGRLSNKIYIYILLLPSYNNTKNSIIIEMVISV